MPYQKEAFALANGEADFIGEVEVKSRYISYKDFSGSNLLGYSRADELAGYFERTPSSKIRGENASIFQLCDASLDRISDERRPARVCNERLGRWHLCF